MPFLENKASTTFVSATGTVLKLSTGGIRLPLQGCKAAAAAPALRVTPKDDRIGPLMVWNVQSMVRAGRKEHIQRCFRNYAVLAMTGTRYKQNIAKPVPVELHSNDRWLELHSNVKKDRGNSMSGVMLCFNQRWIKRKNVVSISWPPSARIQGRCLSVRVKRGKMDALFMVVYWPP